MKIQLLSDLHLETNGAWQAQAAPEADLLVLAGDIGSYQVGTRLSDIHFGLSRFSPKQGWPCPVIFVPGNHEYDALDFERAHDLMQTACERLGIIWLERQTRVWPNPSGDAVRIIGTTLWTDFDALANRLPKSHAGKATSAHRRSDQHNTAQAAREKAYRAANHYLRKTGTRYKGAAMLAEQVRAQGLLCQAWLEQALQQPFDGKTVVVTHFAPSLHSADPRYGLTPGTAGFCNALDHLLPQASHWLHGHLHSAHNYTHQGCKVIANPLGYASKGEQAQFDPLMCINV